MNRQGQWGLPTLKQAGILLAAALSTPMQVWAVNLAKVASPEGALVWSAFVWALALGVLMLGVRREGEPEGLTYALFWLVVAVGAFGSLVSRTPGGALPLWVLALLLALIAYWLRWFPAYRWFTTWAVTMALVVPTGTAVAGLMARGPSTTPPSVRLPIGDFVEEPDVLIIVFDAHGSPPVLSRFLGYALAFDRLTEAGLLTSTTMRSNYTFTHLSLASFFRMDYPVVGGETVGDAEWVALLRAVRGDSALVDAFRAQGYQFVIVESGWHGIACTASADVCVNGPWPDALVSKVMEESLLGRLVPVRLTESGPRRNLHSVAWLESGLDEYLSNGIPDLLFVHLVLPHAPFRIDERCRYREDGGESGIVVADPNQTPALADARKRLYIDQVRCAQRVLFDVATKVGDEAILVAFGDHGPTSQGQVFRAPGEWTEADVTERLGIFFATNAPDCGLTDQKSLVNVGRALLACLAQEGVVAIEDRFFIAGGSGPLLEVDPDAGGDQ